MPVGMFSIVIIVLVVIISIMAVAIALIKKTFKGKSENNCPKCGKPVKIGKNFCTSCGAKME